MHRHLAVIRIATFLFLMIRAVVGQAYESNNGNELIGVNGIGRDLRIPYTAMVRLNGEAKLVCSSGTTDCLGEQMEGSSPSSGKHFFLHIKRQPTSAYIVEYHETAGTPWLPLCQADTGPEAVLIRGAWNKDGSRDLAAGPSVFTFACKNSAAYRCRVELKYNDDDASSIGDPASRDRFQTCTRMVRADYCGDGTSHTIHWLSFDVKDDALLYPSWSNTPGSDGWIYEAHWGVGGAVCINNVRDLDKPISGCPTMPPHCTGFDPPGTWPTTVLMKTLTNRPVVEPDSSCKVGRGLC